MFFFCFANNPYGKGGIMSRRICNNLSQMVVVCWFYLIFNYYVSSRIRFFCQNIYTISTDISFRFYQI